MTIAKALKNKNLFVKEVKELQTKIQEFNSTVKGSDRPYDIEELYLMILKKTEELAALKTLITAANQPIQQKIYRLSELKGIAKMLQDLNVKKGSSLAGYREVSTIEYEAQITTKRKDELLAGIENEIETLQEELDIFNHTTSITK